MPESSINQFSLLNTSKGPVKILEYDMMQEVVYIWSLEKKYNYCENCTQQKDFFKCALLNDCPEISKHKDDIQDDEYLENGEFESISGPYSSVREYIVTEIITEYPDCKVIPLGIFKSVQPCRSYLKNIKSALKDKVI